MKSCNYGDQTSTNVSPTSTEYGDKYDFSSAVLSSKDIDIEKADGLAFSVRKN